MANKNPNKSTRFKPGVSGNYNGRPKGSTSKWSLKKFSEELSKTRGEALNNLKEIMRSDKHDVQVQLKAILAILSQDKIVQDMIYNQMLNDIKIERENIAKEIDKQKLEKLKAEPKGEPEEKQEIQSGPVIQLYANKE